MIEVLLLAAILGMAGVAGAESPSFEESLARVDQELKTNPNYVGEHALYSCQDRRNHANRMYRSGNEARALRSLKYCFNLLGITEDSVARKPDPAELEKRRVAAAKNVKVRAEKEFELALSLEPDIENGLEIFRGCAACHTPEGWGMRGGMVPQLAGQHRKVVIKQLADIRAGNRENRVMQPYSTVEAIGGEQAVADVAGYIDTLEISIENGRGSGEDLKYGEQLYAENCVRCHGEKGQGDNEKAIPRIQSQHYGYLVDQFELIRDGKRRNADPEMVKQIKEFKAREIQAVMDFVSRLEPPVDLQAPPGWRNPDFANPVPIAKK